MPNHRNSSTPVALRFSLILLASLALLALATCGKDSPTKPSPPQPPPPPPVQPVPTRITITPATVTLTAVGQTRKLTASVLDQNGQLIASANVSWSSSSTAVATVSSQGLVTAVMNGTAQITARAGNASASVTVTVAQSAIRITISPPSATLMAIGQTVQLTAAVLDQNGQPVRGAVVNWSSSNENVATVTSQGLVTAVMNGTAQITARLGTVSAHIDVTVMQEAGSIVIEPKEATLMAIGETVQLSATVLDQNGQPVDGAVVTWSSSDEAVATVSAQGLVTAVMNGTAQITARTGNASASVTVTVAQSAVRITITPPSATLMAIAGTVQLTVTVLDQNGQSVDGAVVTWQSSDEAVATVSPQGLVTAVMNGAAQITARTGNASASVTVTVAQSVVRITISPPSAALMAIGESVQLTTTVLDQNGQPVDGAVVTWSSSDEAVVTVSPQGLVTAVMNGTAQITARAGNTTTTVTVTVMVTTRDREALVALYNSTNGPAWTDNTNWLNEGPLGEWYGVDTNVNGEVVSLSLVRNNLQGSLPSEIGQLSNLRTLNLRENQLSGNIPPEIGQLTNLTLLHLLYNQLSGNIPPEIGQLTNLRHLHLRENQLSGNIPPEIGQLTNLKVLVLLDNQLSGNIPPEIGQLTNLTILALYLNHLSGHIPPEIGQLGKLQTLGLFSNQLSGHIPPEIGQLVDLEELLLGENGLSGPIPPEIGQLGKLQRLWLFSNQLSGHIPPEIGQLTNLTELQLHRSPHLTGTLPLEITKLLNLEVLYLTTNICIPQNVQFQSWLLKIPSRSSDIVFCSNFERDALIALYSSTNGPNWANSANWSGFEPLGEWYGVTTDTDGRVTELDLQSNNLSGPLPSVLSNLNSLKSLNLSFNSSLAGAIPHSFTKLSLEGLTLEGTMLCAPPNPEFQGWLADFPMQNVFNCTDIRDNYYTLATLYNNTNGPNWTNDTNWLSDEPFNTWYGLTTDVGGDVTGLNLRENNLHGPLPLEIGQLSRLQHLDLSGNQLTGHIPPEIGQLENLNRLQLNNNSLTGALPREIGQLRELTQLSLIRNRLTENIPPEIGQLTRLQHLDLSGNRLSGHIPPEIGQLTRLQYLGISNSQLSGHIPPEIGQLENLNRLQLSYNSLTGALPREIGQLRELTQLRLIRNRLTENIPPEIGQLTRLQYLGISNNQLSGHIPPEIGQLENLYHLQLGNNSLSGPIPQEIGHLRELTQLRLNGNQLTGHIPPEIGQLVNIDGIWLNENKLSGSIPPEFNQLQNITKLYLNANELTAHIPPELGMLNKLEELQFSSNQLNGNIPTTFGNLSSLRFLDLSLNNGMSGALSEEITLLELDELLLGGTQICVSDDSRFQDWLRTIPNSRIARCEGNTERAKVYLVQATQSFEYPVPLVADEDAYLRVFLATETELNVAIPPVQANFYQDGVEIYTVDIPSNGSFIPTEIDEGNLSASVNTRIPGSIVKPGLEMVVELDPDSRLDPSPGIPSRLPSTGRMTIDVRTMPSFDLTMVPLLWTANPDRETQMQVEVLTAESDLFKDTRDLLPVGVFNLEIREPVWTSVEASWQNCNILLSELSAIRAMDGATGYYTGVINDFGGLATLGGTESMAILDPLIIAHELGHNLNLRHAPCATTSFVDPNYPNSLGSIGAWGYDLESDVLVNPVTPDLMSYCHPQWISDYNFNKAMNYRLSREQTTSIAAAFAPKSRSLLLWGRVNENGEINLEPSFVVDAPSTLPDLGGPYLLTGEGLDGSTLFNLSFDMSEFADSEGGSFAFVLPIDSVWANRLARITLSGPEGVVTLGGHEDEETQDALTAALLMDSVTGKVRGILRDWPETAVTDAYARRVLPEPGLEVVISTGVPNAADWDR